MSWVQDTCQSIMDPQNPPLADTGSLGAPRTFVGIYLHAPHMQAILSLILESAETKRRLTVTYVNHNYIVAAAKNAPLRQAINSFQVILPDSSSVLYGARLLGLNIEQRLSTDEVCLELFRHCQRLNRPIKIFLLGGRRGIAENAAHSVVREFPIINVVGCRDGWFQDSENFSLIQFINSSNPDILLVCLGTPRQQFWANANHSKLTCPVVMTGGAYLDHLAVSADQYYPRWINRAKLNWLYRFCTEPRHVWKRYTIELLVYVALVLRYLLRWRSEQP